MKIVFFGTPDYVLPIVVALHKAFRSRSGKSPIVAVITQAPKPVGREKKLTYSPVDAWAHKRKVQIFYKAEELIKNGIKADLGILAAYGEIIPKNVIDLFPHGILNVHPSLLPKYRGASPVAAAIVAGETETGVTIIKLDEKLDHGPIISQFTEEILSDDTNGSLRARLFERAVEVLTTLIPPYLRGKITPRKQDDAKATFTTQITKAHGFISPEYFAHALQGLPLQKLGKWEIPFVKDYTLVPSAYSLERFIRAMDPWPGAWTHLSLGSSGQAKRLKILKIHLESLSLNRYTLIPDLVQLEGKNPVSWKQFREGYASVMFE